MATEDQLTVGKRGAGQVKMSKAVTVTMAAGVAATDSTIIPPQGSRVSSISWHTSGNFTGSPTNIYLSVGKTAGAQEYVGNVDVKTAAAPTAATLVAAADWSNWPVGQGLFATITAVGGTNPAGSVVVEANYSPPNP